MPKIQRVSNPLQRTTPVLLGEIIGDSGGMTTNHYDPRIHHRRSIRLKGYDYTQAGAYCITVVTQGRVCLLGEVADGAMVLNDAGHMIQAVWDQIPSHYQGVQTDAFVVMPNHIHGIVILVGAGPRACPDPSGPRASPDPDVGQHPGPGVGQHPGPGVGQRPGPGVGQRPGPRGGQRPGPRGGQPQGQPQGVAPTMSLADVVHRFKTLTTKRYIDGVKQRAWPPFPGKLWQRNYYEHIIRDETDLNGIRRYIVDNPARWMEDAENPEGLKPAPTDDAGTEQGEAQP